MDSIIIKYLEGTASKEEIQTLQAWLQENIANKKYFYNYSHIWYSSQESLPDAHSIDEAFFRFRTKVLDIEKKNKRKRMVFQGWKAVASVAILVVCSVGAYWLGNYSPDQLTQSEEKEVMLNHIYIRNAKSRIELPDGTSVWLNDDSKLIYPSLFAANERTVKLEGEAFFDVVRNESSPFFVKTENMTIKVLGTSFSLKNDKNNTLTETVLVTGKLEISFNNEDVPVFLYPNQKVSYRREESTYTVEDVDASEYILWKNDRLVMINEPLEAIFRKMERWYGIEIVCRGTLPLQSKYSITITDEPKEEILRLLSITHPIQFTMENKKVIIRER